MSKLQEIKEDLILAKSEGVYTINSVQARNKVIFEHADWLIEQLEQEKMKIRSVKQALADGPQPCPGGVTAEQYNAWLHSVLPFLEECELDESSSIASDDN